MPTHIIMSRRASKLILFLAVSLVVAELTAAHSFLLEPAAYNNTYDNGQNSDICTPFKCPPCPLYKPNNPKTGNHPDEPAAIWQRGQTVTIRWARNNHHGGFIRLALVPVEKMDDHNFHDRLAFYYGCWEQNKYKCDEAPCGKDKRDFAFRQNIVVPAVIPDGSYVLAWAWFGGIDFTKTNSKFPDYYSCSFVHIRGGVSLVGSFQPYFDAGSDSEVAGKCRTGNTALGICTRKEQCDNGSVSYDIPRVFHDNSAPAPITIDLYFPPYHMNPPSISTPLPSPSATPAVSMSVQTFSPVPTVSPTMEASSQEPSICAGPYCCPASCGKCGGRGCSNRPGGREKCCSNTIKRSNRFCKFVGPPCRRR